MNPKKIKTSIHWTSGENKKLEKAVNGNKEAFSFKEAKSLSKKLPGRSLQAIRSKSWRIIKKNRGQV